MIFDEDTISDFDPNAFEIGSKILKGNMKYDATITSYIDNERMNFRVKLSKCPDFDRNKDSCLKFRASFKPYRKQQAYKKH